MRRLAAVELAHVEHIRWCRPTERATLQIQLSLQQIAVATDAFAEIAAQHRNHRIHRAPATQASNLLEPADIGNICSSSRATRCTAIQQHRLRRHGPTVYTQRRCNRINCNGIATDEQPWLPITPAPAMLLLQARA